MRSSRRGRSDAVIRAVLFDLDGVLADTERLQWAAYRHVLDAFGIDVGLEEYRRHWIATGQGPEYACRTYSLPLTPDELRAEKARVYNGLLREGIAACPGDKAALVRLGATHRLALVTNTARAEVAMILDQLASVSLLHVTIAREDYRAPKPAPDGYLAAAAALRVTPRECAVVEDTERGVRAALAADMWAIAMPNELTVDNDFTGCARRLTHLDELTVELLETVGRATPP